MDDAEKVSFIMRGFGSTGILVRPPMRYGDNWIVDMLGNGGRWGRYSVADKEIVKTIIQLEFIERKI